jgi:septum formation protein
MLTDRLRKYQIVLGSGSPRRQELLADMGFIFDIVIANIDETCPDSIAPEDVALYLAEAKMAKLEPVSGSSEIMITADTIVLCDNKVVPKPSGKEEAVAFLKMLSGRSHSVITGVCIASGNRRRSFSTETVVTFCEINEEEIEWYVDNFRPYDKAGGYGIQEWIGFIAVEKIEGSYFNVMGLPVNKLYRELKEFIK